MKQEGDDVQLRDCVRDLEPPRLTSADVPEEEPADTMVSYVITGMLVSIAFCTITGYLACRKALIVLDLFTL
eukprot:5882331-Amphidinium_carterae.2